MSRLFSLLIWLPFAVLGNPGFFLVVMIVTFAKEPDRLVTAFVLMLFVGIPSRAIAQRIRPPSIKSRGVPVEKAIASSLVRMTRRVRGRAAKLRVIRRRLSPELRALLSGPVDRQPEAILHERRQAQGAKAA